MRIVSWLVVMLFVASVQADDWPQWRGPGRDGIWRESGLVERLKDKELKRKWTAEIGPGYSGPTVAAGRVFVTDRIDDPKQIERVHCFDEQTGKKLWTFEYPCDYTVGYKAGPRACVTVDADRAYALGAMGNFYCFNAADGRVLWNKDLNAEYEIRMPIWGISAAPLVEGELVIVQIGGKRGACLVAFDKTSGVERWRALDDNASYTAPIMIEQAGRRVLLCLTGDNVVGLDPRSGSVFWKYPFPPAKMVISIATPVVERDHVFFTSFYDGSLMLRLLPEKLAVEKVWRRQGLDEKTTDALHSIIATPLLIGDYVYGVDSYGELRCLSAATGDRIWEDQTATPRARWSTIHMVRNGANTWMLNERGDLIIARLSPEGYHEVSRSHLLDPTTEQLRQRGGVCWSHPAFANRCVFARNDNELVCASLAAE
jgi:outer membrane protein assembly factor BamB